MVLVAMVTLLALVMLTLLLRNLGPLWRARSGWIATTVCVGLAASFASLIWASSAHFPPLPTLLRGLSGNGVSATGSRQLTDRLQIEFRIGTAESKLIRELWLEGFRPVTDLGAPERVASFTRMGDLVHDICRTDAEVLWSADSTGRLMAVSGGYWKACP